jgi:putative flippase GtrA
VLNQLFTYREQVQGIHGWDWIRRFFKGQLTSLSATLMTYLVALALVYFFAANKYLANDIGIVLAFIYNFFISNKLVFRPTTTPGTPPLAESEVNAITVNVEPKVESTPK